MSAKTPRQVEEILRAYDARRRKEFSGKWLVERVIGAVVGSAPLINRAARNLSVRKAEADLLIGVTGDFVPATEVVRLSYLWKVFSPFSPRTSETAS